MSETAVTETESVAETRSAEHASENVRLHRALRAMYTREITWLKSRRIREDSRIRVGLYDLNVSDGPSLIAVYRTPAAPPMIRVVPARAWAESALLNSGDFDTDPVFEKLAKEVLRFLGEHKL